MLEKFELMVSLMSQALLLLTITATILSRIIAKGKYKENVNGFAGVVLEVVRYLPTLGINPHTRLLENQLKEIKGSGKRGKRK